MAAHSVAFDVRQPGAYAVQLRLTPALLEALLAAQEEGQPVSIQFGQGTRGGAITVAGTPFGFNALPEDATCDVLSLPPSTPSGGTAPGGVLVGTVRQKLMVLRNIEDERERVRARAEEAERRGHERKAQLLDGRPAAAGKRRLTTTTVQRVTPPPSGAAAAAGPHQQRQRGPTPPQQLTASMLAPAQPPAARPPSQLSMQQHQRARSATPPPTTAGVAAAGGKPMHKSASTSRLGGKQGAGAASGGAPPKQPPSARVMQAARSGASLRLVLIAMLSERQMARGAIKNALADVAARVRSFKQPSKHELERTLKAVAEYKAPGTYVLYPMLLQELTQLAAVSSLSPPDSHQSGEAIATGAATGGRMKKKQAAAVTAAFLTVAGAVPPTAEGSEGTAAAGKAAGAAGSKRGRYDWTDDDSDGEQPPAAPRLRIRTAQPQQEQASAHAATLAGSAASPPSIGGAPAAGGGSSGGGVRRTSSNRGSQQADESWIEEHADRQPKPAAPITCREDFAAREVAFDAKYKVYFELHQLIQAHKKDFEALAAAVAQAPTAAERERLRGELERLHRQRGERAKRWDQAFSVLHQELAADKARMAEYVAALQAQQAPQAGQAAGSVPPVVRVN